MGARLTDSAQYAHLWGTPELVAVFDDRGRVQSWLDILAALATAQARLGLIPEEAAAQIRRHAHADRLDMNYVAEQTRLTSHSTLGLIRGLQRILPDSAREHVYRGATVQDVTDTWFGLVMRAVGRVAWRDLRAIEDTLLDLAVAHRATVLAGRTHGQPGAPITFGFKVGVVGRRGPAACRPAGRGPVEVGGRPARRRRRRVGLLRPARAGLAGRVLPRAGPCRPRRVLADRPGPDRRVRRRPDPDLRHARAHRRRGLRAAATGDRRVAGADDAGHGRQYHHASQAQSRGQRAPEHAGPARSGERRRALRRHGRHA